MADLTKKSIPLYVSSEAIDRSKPFEGDLFERKALAERLTTFLHRLPDGGVIAIDAAWGDGKTWFGQNWHAALCQGGYKTAFIDAFESDYVDDPFLLLVAEVERALADVETEVRAQFSDVAVRLGKLILPSVAKGLMHGVSSLIIGAEATKTVSEVVRSGLDAAEDKIEDALGEELKERLKDLQQRTQTVVEFRHTLTAMAAQSSLPTVIFVDELDRCRPSFAVQTLERTKHFFDVKNIVFVLLLNRRQLEATIKHVYGNIDSHEYLSKFLTLTISLPKADLPKFGSDGSGRRFIISTGKRLGYTQTNAFMLFVDSLAVVATVLSFSYRDIERALTLYAVSGVRGNSAPAIAWLIGLKLRDPDRFRAISGGSRTAHADAARWIDELRVAFAVPADELPLNLMYLAHGLAGRVVGEMSETDKGYMRELIGGFQHDIGAAFKHWTGLLSAHIS